MKRKNLKISNDRKMKQSSASKKTSSKTSHQISKKDISKDSLQINVIPHQKSSTVSFHEDVVGSKTYDHQSQDKFKKNSLSKLKYKNSISIKETYYHPLSQKSQISQKSFVKGNSTIISCKSVMGSDIEKNLKPNGSLRPTMTSFKGSKDNWSRQSKASMSKASVSAPAEFKDKMLNLDLWKLKDIMEKFPVFKLDLVSNLSTRASSKKIKKRKRRKNKTIISICICYCPIERNHLMLIGHKNGVISIFKRNVKDIANVIYDYAHQKDLFSLENLILKQKNVDLQTMQCYEQSKFVICGVTSGVIHIIDRNEDIIAQSVIGHSGNITCLNIYLRGFHYYFNYFLIQK